MLKSWSEDKEPICEHGDPACQACILQYVLALVEANRELMLKAIWQSRELLMNGEGTIRELMDKFETLEELTGAVHTMIEKALKHDPTFLKALRKLRDYCRCQLAW